MPTVKPQHLKSLHTISLQPKTIDTPRIDAIMCMDLAGKGTCEIARELGLEPSRVSIIKGTPLYIQQRDVMRSQLKTQFSNKQTDRLVHGDPVMMALKDAALDAAMKKIALMKEGRSEFVQLAASSDILDRAGYKASQDKTVVSVQITEKMADRFEKAITFKRTQQHNQTTGDSTADGQVDDPNE